MSGERRNHFCPDPPGHLWRVEANWTYCERCGVRWETPSADERLRARIAELEAEVARLREAMHAAVRPIEADYRDEWRTVVVYRLNALRAALEGGAVTYKASNNPQQETD